jgi:hypothetical protein
VRIADHQLDAVQTARSKVTQERQPERAALTRTNIQPEHLPLTIGRYRDRDDDCLRDDSAILTHLDERPIQPDIGIRPFQLARAEPVDLLVEFRAQPADLALTDALHAQRLDQVVDTPRRDALDVCLLDDGHQRALSTSPWFQQARKEAAIAHPWHLQFDRANARIPRPLAMTVAVAASLWRAFVPLCTDVLGELQLHQLLSQHAHALTQEISLFHTSLAQHLGKCHSQLVGHRRSVLSSGLDTSR